MNNIEMEKKLAENGFSGKDITRLNDAISRSKRENETYMSILIDLKKRLYGGFFCVFLLLLVMVIHLFSYDTGETVVYFFVMIFCLIAVYFITPLNLAWKAYRFLSRRG